MTLPRTRFVPGLLAAALAASPAAAAAPANPLEQRIRDDVAAIHPRLVEWRRDIHQHPELGEQETRTAKLVATHLREAGYDVHERVGAVVALGYDQERLAFGQVDPCHAGDLACRLEGDRAWLGGPCVTVVEGSFYLPG